MDEDGFCWVQLSEEYALSSNWNVLDLPDQKDKNFPSHQSLVVDAAQRFFANDVSGGLRIGEGLGAKTSRPRSALPEMLHWKAEQSPLSVLYLLVVDEDASVRSACAEIARKMGFFVLQAQDSMTAHAILKEQKIDLILTDLMGDDYSGGRHNAVTFLDGAKARNPEVSVIVMSAFATVSSAVEAMRMGAEDLLTKPFALEDLVLALERAAQATQVNAESRRTRERLRSQRGGGPLIGQSAEMEKLYRILSKVAHSTHPVLILGESGTGKELVARSIHFNGSNALKSFVPVDCGSLAPSLIEGELFGYVRSSDAGSYRDGAPLAKAGLLSSADGGTIFLDEVADLSLDLQAKLSRALQEKVVRPVGGGFPVPLLGRVLAGSNRDLAALVEQGKFRKDLYYRLNVVNLRIPPLRDRKEDIALLTHYFLERIRRDYGRLHTVADDALCALGLYEWPGNVRELESVIDRACALSSGPVLHLADLPAHFHGLRRPQPESDRAPLAMDALLGDPIVPIAALEKQAILTTIRQLRGDKLMAAKLLGIGKTTLYRKLKEYGISEDF